MTRRVHTKCVQLRPPQTGVEARLGAFDVDEEEEQGREIHTKQFARNEIQQHVAAFCLRQPSKGL